MMFARAASSILLLAGAYPRLTAQDAREIIGRGVALYERNSQLSRNYTFLERQEVRELDRSGHLKGRKIETWDITLLDGSPYRRLVARNDQPLAAEEQRAEEEKLRVSNEERRKETADERAQRLARWQRRIDRQREPVRELLDAFDFTLAGEQQMGGRGVYRIDATPRPGYQPKSQFASFFPKVKLRFWVDKQDYQAARIEMETARHHFLRRLPRQSRQRHPSRDRADARQQRNLASQRSPAHGRRAHPPGKGLQSRTGLHLQRL